MIPTLECRRACVGAGDSPAQLPGATLISECRGSTNTAAVSPTTKTTNRILFITYSTWHRWKLPEIARDLALHSCLRANGRKYELYAAVAMPDHVHLICLPLTDSNGSISIPEITRTIKSESAHRINKALKRTGRVWQDESFDHILRGEESLSKKMKYILENSVRAGIVPRSNDYRWFWWDRTVLDS
jgi:REP element-mobilizing transposase RayT